MDYHKITPEEYEQGLRDEIAKNGMRYCVAERVGKIDGMSAGTTYLHHRDIAVLCTEIMDIIDIYIKGV